ncbi:YeeE/YedE family protein [Aestuariibius sp. 2305UL40-4]|uniref:YeeE/YedE family protein n=1 Tax=Aestuariibius violaceus TaxID=3234132 RepID=UPI00345E195C
MIEAIGEGPAVVLIGVASGICLGLAARLGRFCTLGAIEDVVYARDGKRARMWLAALGTAIALTFLLMSAGRLDPASVFYLTTAWSPAASILGGLTFGYGMALAGNCGFGALARLGGGDLRSLVIVLVMAIATYVTIAGPLAPLRVMLFPEVQTDRIQGIAHGLGGATGISPTAIGLTVAFICLAVAAYGAGRWTVFGWGALAGVAVAGAWAGTAWVAETGFEAIAPQSHSFARPLGETLLWLMSSTGREAGFGVGSVTGVLIGALMGSLIKGHFRWEACDDPRELRRQMAGAALMGVGAVVALGCSIGQGLSAFSVLAISAPVTVVSIILGASVGLRQLVEGFAFIR